MNLMLTNSNYKWLCKLTDINDSTIESEVNRILKEYRNLKDE